MLKVNNKNTRTTKLDQIKMVQYNSVKLKKSISFRKLMIVILQKIRKFWLELFFFFHFK